MFSQNPKLYPIIQWLSWLLKSQQQYSSLTYTGNDVHNVSRKQKVNFL